MMWHHRLSYVLFLILHFFQTSHTLQFSAISVPPVIKTTVRNGRTLVHRVEKENTDVLVPTQPDVMLFTHTMVISHL